MRRLWSILSRLVLVVVILALIGAGLIYSMLTRSLPKYAGEVRVAGLSAPVEILRDANAVPHLFAETREDAIFALGYVHAQDRLWQMALHRLAAKGTLASVFGEQTLDTDIFLRTLGVHQAAEASLRRLRPATLRALEAYSAGVNARLDELKAADRAGGPEFLLFDWPLEPWTPADSVALVKLMGLRLSGALYEEIRQARFAAEFDDEAMADLFPEYPGRGVGALRNYRPPSPLNRGAALEPEQDQPFAEFLPPRSLVTAGASNAWAVDGSRTATGAPLLAADPHLGLTAPGVWYLVHLEAPEFSVMGGTMPGMPAVMIGRNRHVGWGVTASYVDDQDVYLEEVHESRPELYRLSRGWTAFDLREEVFQVAGGPDQTRTIRETVNGPVLGEGVSGLTAILPERHVAALRWTGLARDDTSLDAVLALNGSRSINEVIASMGRHVTPTVNLVVADKDSVAMLLSGRVPLRQSINDGEGRLPSLGWKPENAWIGFVPHAEKPSVVRPFSGAVANANNRISGSGEYPRHLSFDWAPPYRINRIEELINRRSHHTDLSFALMQNDTVSSMAQGVARLMIAALDRARLRGRSPEAAEALALMRAWDGDMDANDAEPLIFAAWARALKRGLLADELGPLFRHYPGPAPLFIERVLTNRENAARWCDDAETPNRRETCAEIIEAALQAALDELAERYGPRERWRWGRAHRAEHRHRTLGREPRRVLGVDLAQWFNVVQEVGGGTYTLNRGTYNFAPSDPYRSRSGAGYRAIYNFSDLDRSLYIAAIGQSGHFLSPYYDNMADRWASGQYLPMSMDRTEAEAGAVGLLTLRPKE